MQIRPFAADDAAAVIALWQACGLTRPWNDPARDIARKLAVQSELFVVGVQDGRLVASVMAGYDGHRGWVNYLAVHPDRRGQGLGAALMRHVEHALLALGCPKLNLQVRSGNDAVLGFYRALGYLPDDVASLGKRLIPDLAAPGGDGAHAVPSLHDRLGLQPVINAAGTFTPLGVSRSPPAVADAVAQVLQEFVDIEQLQQLAGRALAGWSGAPAAAVTHCVAAGITMAVAAAMAGAVPEAVAALPDCRGLPHRVVIPAGHAIDYGHPILTDIRLAGATPVLAGSAQRCGLHDLQQALAQADVACLLLVSSRLVQGEPIDLAAAVALAHARGVPAVIDGAAQDLRLHELLATGADAVLASAHKYLAAPTAGLVLGSAAFVRAFRAQEKGIGRAMKAGKEALVGVLAALDARAALDLPAWRAAQQRKVDALVAQVDGIDGLRAEAVPDPAGMPFARVVVTVAPAVRPGWTATALAERLRAATPAIRVMEHALARQQLVLELVPLHAHELREIVRQLAAARADFLATPPA